jgi:hypothetical protein
MWFFGKFSSVYSMAVLDGRNSATEVFIKIHVNKVQVIWQLELGNVEERVCIGATEIHEAR